MPPTRVIGFAILVFCRDPIGLVFPAARAIRNDDPLLPTAIALTVRNESMNAVLPALGRLLDELDRRGVGDAFAAFILSDTDSALARPWRRPTSLPSRRRVMARFARVIADARTMSA